MNEQEQTLYDRLGPENLRSLIHIFYEKVVADERINHLFKTDMDLVREKQFLFLSQFLGGPQLYTEAYGHPRMRMRHMPHEITPDAAFAWLENMGKSIAQLDIDTNLKQALMQRFPHVAAHMVNSPNKN